MTQRGSLTFLLVFTLDRVGDLKIKIPYFNEVGKDYIKRPLSLMSEQWVLTEYSSIFLPKCFLLYQEDQFVVWSITTHLMSSLFYHLTT